MHAYLETLMDGSYIHLHPGVDWESQIGNVLGAGGHQVNNQNPLFKRRDRQPLRMIVMREPLQRFMSFFRHINDNPHHHLARRPGVTDMTPSEFAEFCAREGIAEFDNVQSKYVVGESRDHSDLETVLSVFDSEFPLFAPIECLPQLMTELSRIFGKKLSLPQKKNVSSVIEISPDEVQKTADIVYSHNYNDLQLYLRCTERFVQEMT